MSKARSAQTILEITEAFVTQQRGKLPEPLTLDTPLRRGLIDSFGLVDLGYAREPSAARAGVLARERVETALSTNPYRR